VEVGVGVSKARNLLPKLVGSGVDASTQLVQQWQHGRPLDLDSWLGGVHLAVQQIDRTLRR